MTGCNRYGDELRSFAIGQVDPQGEGGPEDEQAREERCRRHDEIREHLEGCTACRREVESIRLAQGGRRNAPLAEESIGEIRQRIDSPLLRLGTLWPFVVCLGLGIWACAAGFLDWKVALAGVVLATTIYNSLANRVLDLELVVRVLLREREERRRRGVEEG